MRPVLANPPRGYSDRRATSDPPHVDTRPGRASARRTWVPWIRGS